jgi:hypothetical protein
LFHDWIEKCVFQCLLLSLHMHSHLCKSECDIKDKTDTQRGERLKGAVREAECMVISFDFCFRLLDSQSFVEYSS